MGGRYGQREKEKLLRAATELFARNGYDGVSIREISEAAGVNSAMISYYFGGKRGLYSAALIAQLEELRDFLSLDAEALDPRAVFRRYAEAACAIHEQNPYLLQYIYREFIAASGSAPLPFAKAVFPVYRVLLRAAEREWPKGSSARNWTRRPWSSSSREPSISIFSAPTSDAAWAPRPHSPKSGRTSGRRWIFSSEASKGETTHEKKFLFAALFCLLAALAAGAVYEYRKQQAEAAVLTGTVEATKADITPKQSGYIEKLFVKESDAVTAGETAALLSRKDLEAALLRDEAAYRASLAALEKAANGNRPEEIRKAASETAAARAESDRAGRDYARMKALLEADAVSRQDYDAAKEARDSAAARLAAAEEYQALMESGARAEDIEYARRTAEQNRAARDIAREAVADLTVRVPVSGVILTKIMKKENTCRRDRPSPPWPISPTAG